MATSERIEKSEASRSAHEVGKEQKIALTDRSITPNAAKLQQNAAQADDNVNKNTPQERQEDNKNSSPAEEHFFQEHVSIVTDERHIEHNEKQTNSDFNSDKAAIIQLAENNPADVFTENSFIALTENHSLNNYSTLSLADSPSSYPAEMFFQSQSFIAATPTNSFLTLVANNVAPFKMDFNHSQSNSNYPNAHMSFSMNNPPQFILASFHPGPPVSVDQDNILVRAATAITEIFTSESKPVVTTVAPKQGGGGNDTSSFVLPPPVPLIPHTAALTKPFSVFAEQVVFEDGNNHLFFISSPALSPINASNAVFSINLNGSSTGIVDMPYLMRPAGANVVPLVAGGSATIPGTLVLNPPNNTPGIPDKFDLLLSGGQGTLLASAYVPPEVDAKVTVPAGAELIYNLIIPINSKSIIQTLSDYSAFPSIMSLDLGTNFGRSNTSGTQGIINTSIDLVVIAHNVTKSANLYSVDTDTDVIQGRNSRGLLNNFGMVIEKAPYNYLHVKDADGDGTSDLLFGSHTISDGLLVYGNITPLPALFSLTNLPSNLSSTHFVLPTNNLVGTVLEPGKEPIDGGAALNALANPSSVNINFIGDISGVGYSGLIVEKISTNYAYDSDLLYVINGQTERLPAKVQFFAYGDPKLDQGIIGTGSDAQGNFVKYVHGFTISGPLANNTVAPLSFAAKSIGDINADGFDDLFAFANNNTGYLVFGHPQADSGNNIHLGSSSPFVSKLFFLPNVASSTVVPTIQDISFGYLNGDGLSDIVFSSAISMSALQSYNSAFAKYLTLINSGTGNALGSILSGAFMMDPAFSSTMYSAYQYHEPNNGPINSSHVILGFNNQSVLEGFTGIDNIIAGSGNQTLIQHGLGAVNPNLPGIVGSTLIGGAGNNIFEVANPVFHEVRGGNGFDILKLNSGTLDLTQIPDPSSSDLSEQAAKIVHGIERINLGDNTSLILNANSILNINTTLESTLGTAIQTLSNGSTLQSPVTGTLLVAASNGLNQNPSHKPTVELINDAQHQWSAVNPTTSKIDGLTFQTYRLDSANSGGVTGQPTVIVESNVNVHIS